jgi:hypothetical protein
MIKLIKEREKKCQIEGGECAFIYKAELGAALCVLHCNLPNEFPNRWHQPILYRTAEQEFNQHMKQSLYNYCS